MKKTNSRSYIAYAVFCLLLSISCLWTADISTKAATVPGGAYTEQTIDKLDYTIYTDAGVARLNMQVSTLTETFRIPEAVTYNNKEYKVTSFSTGNDTYENGRYELAFGSETKAKDAKYPDNNYYKLKKLIIPSTINGEITLMDCFSLEEIVFENADGIESYNLVNCPKLKNITFSEKLKTAPFIKNCPSLTVTIPTANPYLKADGNSIYSKDGKILYNVNSATGKYTVKKGVVRVDANALSGNRQITDLYLSDTVKNLPSYALAIMPKLKTIRWSKAITTIDSHTFYGTYKIKTLTLPKNIKKINGKSFEHLKKLKKLYIKTTKLKKSSLSKISKKSSIYVKNNTVKKQVKKYGFKGKIIVK